MSFDNTQYRVFLEELKDLSEFRFDYSLDNPSAGLDPDDPDVKRIIEALAFFSARTKIASLQSVDATNRRLYQQFFSFLLTPLPAMAMIQAKPNGHLTEAIEVPAGTEIGLEQKQEGWSCFELPAHCEFFP